MWGGEGEKIKKETSEDRAGLKQSLVNVHHGNSVKRGNREGERNSCLFLNGWKDLICEILRTAQLHDNYS